MSLKYFKAKDAYEKNKNLENDVILVQNWLNKQSHLPKISEEKIISFLHRCKYDVERTKSRIENFYTVRGRWTEFSQHNIIFSEEIRRLNRAFISVFLPLSIKRNEIIYYWKVQDVGSNVISLVAQLKLLEIELLVALNVLGTSKGLVLVVNPEGYTMSHFLKLNVGMVHKFAFYMQETWPLKLKAVHVYNLSPVFDMLIKFARPLMKKDTVDTLVVHSNIESLYEHVPREELPNECGGNAGTYEELQEQQIKFIEENIPYLLEDHNQVADESKRIGKLTNLDDIFGTEGTFKKIDID